MVPEKYKKIPNKKLKYKKA